MIYTIELTEAENKALGVVAFDQLDWITNAVKERCRIAIDEIYNTEVQRMTEDPTVTSIPADKEAVVLAAEVKSVFVRQAEAEAEMQELEANEDYLLD